MCDLLLRPEIGHLLRYKFDSTAQSTEIINNFLKECQIHFKDEVYVYDRCVGFKNATNKNHWSLRWQEQSPWATISSAAKVGYKNEASKVVYWVEGMVGHGASNQDYIAHAVLLFADYTQKSVAIYNPLQSMWARTNKVHSLKCPWLVYLFLEKIVQGSKKWRVYFTVGSQLDDEFSCRFFCHATILRRTLWTSDFPNDDSWKQLTW